MKRVIFILLAVVALGSLIGWRLYSNKQEINSKNKPVDRSGVSVPVTVVQAARKPIEGNYTTSATLEAWAETDITSVTQGKLVSLGIEVGSTVAKNQEIGKVDTQLRELSLKQANLTAEKLKKDMDRTQTLYEGKAATEVNYNEVKFNYENTLLQAAQIDQQIKDATIKAPVSGIVSSKRLDEGEFVNPGSIIATVTDISRLKAVLFINEKDVYRLGLRQQATITCDLFPGASYTGTVGFISPKGDENHNYRVEVNFDNPGQRLKAGTYVKVEFELGASGEALQIPKACLPEGMKNPYVYVVEAQKAKVRKVTLGRETGEYVEVLSGLQGGENIVESGHINLSEDRLVEITNR